MHRLTPALALLSACWLFAPSTGSAQTMGNLTIYKDDERVLHTMNQLYVTADDCANNTEFKFELRLQTQSQNLRSRLLQVWTGKQGDDCKAADQRKDPNGNNCDRAPCTLHGDPQTITNPSDDLTISLPTRELFGDDEECNAAGFVQVNFLAVDSANCAAPAANLFGNTYSAVFQLRTVPGPVPTNVQAQDGDSGIRITWDKDGGEMRNEYTVYIDPDPGHGCSDPKFSSGEAASTADKEDVQVRMTSSTALNIDTEEYNLDVGDYVAVAVSSEDVAENRSDLSMITCGQRIRTQGIVDQVENETGESIKTCSSTGRPTTGRSALPAALLLLLGLAGWRRARSRA